MKRSLREKLSSLLQTGASNRSIAFGIALGVFVSFSPLYGLQMIICLLLVLAFKRLNRVAVFLGVQLSWLYPPMLYLDYLVGRYMVPGRHLSLSMADFKQGGFAQIWELLKGLFPVLLAGSLVVGAIAGVLAYFFTMMILKRRRGGVRL